MKGKKYFGGRKPALQRIEQSVQKKKVPIFAGLLIVHVSLSAVFQALNIGSSYLQSLSPN
jgi:hypothetical protein